jgi:thiamine biosynthesis lipoprotein ApbE
MPTTSSFPDYGIKFDEVQDFVETFSAVQHAEKLLNQLLSENKNDLDNFYNPSQAYLYKINNNNTYTLVSTSSDVYDLLDKKISLKNTLGILIYTAGWAAPLNSDGEVDQPPSKSPLKRRVSLFVCATDIDFGSALSFQDDPEVVTDPGAATGSLAEAVKIFWNKNKAF